MSHLYYGDNLDVLRSEIAAASVDLVYLDPPFNSNAGYNVLFRSASGTGADASIEAFDDTWIWGEASKNALMDIDGGTNRSLQVMMRAMHDALGDTPLMAYLAMMAVRLVELHRVLKDTGSLYLHCDPTASHYLKLVLDSIFGVENYRSEIVWKRQNAHNDARRKFAALTDSIFFYSKTSNAVFHGVRRELDAEYSSKFYRYDDGDGRLYRLSDMSAPAGGGMAAINKATGRPNGWYVWRGYQPPARGWRYSPETMERLHSEGRIRCPDDLTKRPALKRYLDENKGHLIGNYWDDILPVQIQSSVDRSLGYPTQKPRALLERIIAASSNPGDVVLDPFCGCGTAVDAAQKLGRKWIGIDVTHIAIGMIENRMREGYPGIEFETIGVPRDLASAERLAADDPHQFQQWVSWQVGGFPRDKKGGDKGIDGWFNYLAARGAVETGVISVKAGDIVNPNMVRDLGRVMARDRHRFGLFIMKSPPTKGMREEAASHPVIETEFGRFPALQIVTLADLMQGHRPKLPPLISPVKRAARVETRASHLNGAQGSLI